MSMFASSQAYSPGPQQSMFDAAINAQMNQPAPPADSGSAGAAPDAGASADAGGGLISGALGGGQPMIPAATQATGSFIPQTAQMGGMLAGFDDQDSLYGRAV